MPVQLLNHLHARRASYSVGFTLPANIDDLLRQIPDTAWSPALDPDGHVRDGAWVTELTGLLTLTGWPPGMRVIIRAERPHPGAQLRITDIDGNRVTAFTTNTTNTTNTTGQLQTLELRHRRQAPCEDRIRCAKDTGLMNLPLHETNQNRIWLALVSLACETTTSLQMLALPDHRARRWEPKRLRLRLFATAARISRTARRTVLHLAADSPFTELLLTAISGLRALPEPPD